MTTSLPKPLYVSDHPSLADYKPLLPYTRDVNNYDRAFGGNSRPVGSIHLLLDIAYAIRRALCIARPTLRGADWSYQLIRDVAMVTYSAVLLDVSADTQNERDCLLADVTYLTTQVLRQDHWLDEDEDQPYESVLG